MKLIRSLKWAGINPDRAVAALTDQPPTDPDSLLDWAYRLAEIIQNAATLSSANLPDAETIPPQRKVPLPFLELWQPFVTAAEQHLEDHPGYAYLHPHAREHLRWALRKRLATVAGAAFQLEFWVKRVSEKPVFAFIGQAGYPA